MKKFHFSLEKVLHIRAWEEEAARLALGRETGALGELERLILLNEEAKRGAGAERFGGGDFAANMRALDNFHLRLDAEKAALLERHAKQHLAVEEAAQKWREAAAEKKALENLKARKKETYRKESLAAEEAEADEIGGRKRKAV